MFLTPSVSADFLLLAIIALMAGHTWSLYERRQWVLFDPLNTFWAGILICFVLQPVVGYEVFVSWHDQSVFIKTLLATLWGLGFVVLGYELVWGERWAAKAPRPPGDLSSSGLLICALLFIGLALVGYGSTIRTSGGWAEWISVGRGGTDYEKVKGYLPELSNLLPLGVLLLFFRAQVHRHRLSIGGQALAWCGALLVLWWFLYLGSRSRFIMTVTCLLAAYYLPRRKNPAAVVTAALVGLTVFCVNLQEYRGQFTNLSLHLGEIDRQELWGAILPSFLGGSADVKTARITRGAEFNCAMAAVELVPRSVPYSYGYGFLEVFTRPIPRRFWDSKPYPHMESQQALLQQAELSSATLSTATTRQILMGPALAFVGYWYLAGGWIGLALGGLITGILFRFVRGLLDHASGNQSILAIYPFLLGIGFNEAVSTPWYWLFSLPFIICPALLAFYFIRVRPTDRPVDRGSRKQTPRRGRAAPASDPQPSCRAGPAAPNP